MKILLSHICEEKKFFEFTESADVFRIPEVASPVNIRVHVYMSGHDYKLDGEIGTDLTLTCDRCLSPYSLAVKEDFSIVFSGSEESDGGSVFALAPQDVAIDLTDFVSNSLLLNIPMKQVCSENCKGLCTLCGANLNETTCNCHKDKVDPRWDKLKELKKSLETSEE